MPKIVGYYQHPTAGFGAGPLDFLGVGQQQIQEQLRPVAEAAIQATWPAFERRLNQTINEKMIIAGVIGGIAWASLMAAVVMKKG